MGKEEQSDWWMKMEEEEEGAPAPSVGTALVQREGSEQAQRSVQAEHGGQTKSDHERNY